MIKINCNNIRREAVHRFQLICNKCGSCAVEVEIGGAEEHGEVGDIIIKCLDCGSLEYGEQVNDCVR